MVDERYIAKRIRELRKNANMDAIRKTAIELLNLLARPVGLEPTTVYRLRLTWANAETL